MTTIAAINTNPTTVAHVEANIQLCKRAIWEQAKRTANPKAYILKTGYMRNTGCSHTERAYNLALSAAKTWAKTPTEKPAQKDEPTPQPEVPGARSAVNLGMSKKQLQQLCANLNLPVSGTKAQLVARIDTAAA